MFCHYASLPWSQWFFLKFFFAKERVSREAAITRLVVTAWGSLSRERGEKFQGKPVRPEYTLYSEIFKFDWLGESKFTIFEA